jgi:hypothetical protein
VASFPGRDSRGASRLRAVPTPSTRETMSQHPQPTLAPTAAPESNGTDPRPGDTRVFLFHRSHVAHDPGAAMDEVNQWLAQARIGTAAADLQVRGVTITPDGAGGIYATIVCSGLPAGAVLPRPAPAPPRSTRSLPSRAAAPRTRRSTPWSVNLLVAFLAFLAVLVLIMTFLAWRT